jgi:hypothetical protein
MRLVRTLVPVVAAAFLAGAALSGEGKKFEKTVPFADKETKLGIKMDKVSIDAVRFRHWPDPDDLRKGEKDLNDHHTVIVEFEYSNRDEDTDYKCHYKVWLPGDEGKPFGEEERTATLDKGKIGDTNKLTLRLKTHHFKDAKSMKIEMEIWKKS